MRPICRTLTELTGIGTARSCLERAREAETPEDRSAWMRLHRRYMTKARTTRAETSHDIGNLSE